MMRNYRWIVTTALAIAAMAAGCGGGGKAGDADADAGDTVGDTGGDTGGDTAADDAATDTGGDDGAEAVVECTADGDCDDGDPCTTDTCDLLDEACEHDALDADGDGYPAEEGPGGEDCGGTDCDDGDADHHPDAVDEGCDVVDSNCNGSVAEGIDVDMDGWVSDECTGITETPPGLEGVGDCDDGDAGTYPGAAEGCDGTVDNDCDGDETDVESDADGDGHSPASCGGDDCDDTRADTYAGAAEICDDVDQDCDGGVLDADGADDDSDTVLDEACAGGTDCDDEDAATHPDAAEACDAVDQDCDGSWADGGADDDSDGVLDALCGGTDCNDLDMNTRPGLTEGGCDLVDNDCDGDAIDGPMDSDDDDYIDTSCSDGDDCDDTDAAAHPGATEECDGVDQDCDGSWADGGADDDGDTVLDEGCGGTDCDDADAGTRPGAAESACDLVDRDCDGSDAEWIDDDGDGWIDSACTGIMPGYGTYSGFGDCADTDAGRYPGAVELCDGWDQDCDGTWADGGADDDGDTHLDVACGGTDCDDMDAGVHWGAPEVCFNAVDEDCDGIAGSPGMEIADLWVGPGEDPAIVWTGSEHMVASIYKSTSSYVYVDRISAAGALVGTASTLFTSTSNSSNPDADWSGSEMGVAWQQWDGPASNDEIYFARASAAGGAVGSAVRITTTAGDSQLPSIAWSGSQWIVAWYEAEASSGDDPQILVARLSGTGSKVGSDLQAATGTYVYWPRVAWTGSEVGVTWMDGRALPLPVQAYFTRFTPAGVKVGGEVAVSAAADDVNFPALAWAGSQFAVAWHDYRSGSYSDLFMQRFSATGVMTGPEAQVTDLATLSHIPAIAWTGSFIAVAWPEDSGTPREIYLSFVSPSGVEMGPDLRVTNAAGSSTGVDVVAYPGQVALAWTDYRTPSGTYFNMISSVCE